MENNAVLFCFNKTGPTVIVKVLEKPIFLADHVLTVVQYIILYVIFSFMRISVNTKVTRYKTFGIIM